MPSETELANMVGFACLALTFFVAPSATVEGIRGFGKRGSCNNESAGLCLAIDVFFGHRHTLHPSDGLDGSHSGPEVGFGEIASDVS